MTNDVYVRMLSAPVLGKEGKVVCERHPIQDEWKQKDGDRCYLPKDFPMDGYYKGIKIVCDEALYTSGIHNQENWIGTFGCIWLPSQEQWQEKYQKYLERSINKNDNVWSILNKLFSYTDDHLYQYELSEHLTILWCLFVSKEVIWKQVGSGITFDWDKNVWRKI